MDIRPNGDWGGLYILMPVTPHGFHLSGSCAYRSPTTGTQYVFKYSENGEFLQYEVSPFVANPPNNLTNPTHTATLVRSFTGGSGGQVRRCIADEDAGSLFIADAGTGLWRYSAEPTASSEGTLVAVVGEGSVFGGVEGITLLNGKTPQEGLIIVSCHSMSAFSVFRRAPPHAHVGFFVVGASADGTVDAVTNPRGIAAVSRNVSTAFPHGLLVVSDAFNEPALQWVDAPASLKLVSAQDIVERLGVTNEVDPNWDPRA
jgi:3-phytase